MKSCALTLFFVAGIAASAFAHEGGDHAAAPGSESTGDASSGPIEVSELAQRNLGLVVAEAELRSIETTLRVIGELQADPARSGTVSSRISGRVSAVLAQEGERVEKGQPLAEVESRQLGNPPPRARYASPVTGIVMDRHVVVGDDVEPNRHLLEVADLREVLAVGRVFEGQIGRVAVGQQVRVRVPSDPDAVFEGVVERLGGQLDPVSRSLAVYIRVANPDERLRPRMRATLSLVTGGAEVALAIPKNAVLGEAGNLYAFVQDEERTDRFERRPLVIGVSDDRFVEVIEGLVPGERVVTEGNYALQYLAPIPEETDEGAAVAPEGDGEIRARREHRGVAALLGTAGVVGALVAAALLYRHLRVRPRATHEVH